MLRIMATSGLRALTLVLLGAQALVCASAITPGLPGNPAPPAPQTPTAQIDACPAIPFATPFDREISRGETHCYSFTLKAGQFAQAVVEQHGIDVVVSIYGQEGRLLTAIDRLNSTQGPETISLIAPSSGLYRLQIKSDQSPSARGRYQIVLKEPRAAVPSDDKLIGAEKLVLETGRLMAKNTAETLRRARTKFEIAAMLWEEAGVPYEAGLALYSAGVCSRLLGANKKAIEFHERALKLMQEVNDAVGVAIVRGGGMGWSYYHLGALDRALKNFEQSLQTLEKVKDRIGAGRARYGIGLALIVRKENQQALENFQESLRLREAEGDLRGAALTRIGLGKAYFRLGRYDESRAALEEALQTMRKFGSRGGQIDALGNLGWVDVWLKKDDAKAGARFREMLRISLDSDDRYSEANARLGLAVLARRAGALHEALDQIKRGVEIRELFRAEGAVSSQTESDNHRLSIDDFAQVQEFYEVYIDLLMSLDAQEPEAGHAAEALHVSELARARNLLDLLARSEASDAELGAARPLRADEIQQRLLDDNTVLLEYALGSAGYAENDRGFLWLVSSAGVESHILPNRADVEAAARRVYELLTERNRASGPRRRELIAQADAQFQNEARKLSEMLFGPVAAKLAGKRLLIAPQGALQFVPFAALPLPEAADCGLRIADCGLETQKDEETAKRRRKTDPQSAIRNPQSYTPLIARHEVIVVPSASALAAIVRQKALRKPARRSVIVFADPVYSADDDRVNPATRRSSGPPLEGKIRRREPADAGGDPNLSRLSATAWEAQKIRELAKDKSSIILSDFDASREKAIDPMLGEYRFIHFATHAVINQENPDLSAIALSQVDERGRPVSGLLSTQDIHRLRLPAELVVLSACRSGLGKDAPGEGLLSLTRGFLVSGAARVMVTLWSIEDQATAEMMSRFYRRVLGPQQMTPAAALRATQEEMWREGRWGAPYYWSGFALQGDWR
ncbi:MAG TPA: CHAT domain-containing tetratricopeptide repeat protein [Blastocatellia bacterium]|nr:CHAT domain-containing tetratricopeptide repeat protein [Blastocatellia bacterium]